MDDQPGSPLAPAPVRPAPVPPEPQAFEPPPGEPHRRRYLLWWLLALIVLAGAVAWIVVHANRQAVTAGRFTSSGPTPVGTATVVQGDMPITLAALGTVTPLATVTLKTQINGQLIDVGFTEGQMVAKGDFLAQIDPRPYQVALEQALGQLAKDQALLKNAELDLVRYRTLVAQNSVARQTLDTQVSLVEQDRGTVQTDQAQVDTQKLNLAYCHIVSPVAGRVGLRQVDPGNYVQTSDANGLVVITQLQPISVIFTLPEDNLPAVLSRVHAGATLPVTALDRSGATKLDTGQLATIDNEIDTTTGTLKLRATFANSSQNLFPNQFVNIQLLVDTVKGTDIVPDAAIQRGAPGTYVYLVKPDNTVTAQPVTLGPDDGQNVAVTKGLAPGQVVVIDGADRLKDGAKVTIPAAAPAGGNPPGATPTPGATPKPGATPTPGATPAPGATPPAGTNPPGQPPQREHHGQGQRRSGQ
jgi:multidrug efflux system membrane fusion protein